MMKIADILEQEKDNVGGILLFKEGCFFRAYNYSAMRFVEHINPIKIIVKHFKNVKQDVFYCGLPSNSLDDIEKIAKERGFDILIKDDEIRINGIDSDKEDFEKWKQSFSVMSGVSTRHRTVNERQVTYEALKTDLLNNIYQKIIQFPLENKTPMQTMQFVQELKQLALNVKSQINGNLRSSSCLQSEL